jgi:signal transduction histidine kinase
MNSLRRKVALGYAAIGALVVAVAVLAFAEVKLLEEKIMAGERVGEFFGVALEIRRFEKNYFLYRQDADLAENRRYVSQAQSLLREQAVLFESLAGPAQVARQGEVIGQYAALMEQYRDGDDNALLEVRIRQAGKEIVTAAEKLSRAQQAALQAGLDRQRQLLIAAVVAVALLVTAIIASLSRAFNYVIRQLELRQGQLVRSEKLAALGTLLSGVAHELNNPLSNISSSCEILAEEIEGGDGAFKRELLEQIDGETWRARRIVRSLLDYARGRDFRKEAVLVAPLIEDTLRLIKGRIAAGVHVERHVRDELAIVGDKQRLQQMLLNLIGNAVEAVGGTGEIAIAARRLDTGQAPAPAGALVFGQCGDGAVLEIEVRDSGHGIAPDVLPRIFDPFFTTKDVGQGMGLGLFVVFEIVEEHGGSIAVASEPGKGTAFFVRLPQGE